MFNQRFSKPKKEVREEFNGTFIQKNPINFFEFLITLFNKKIKTPSMELEPLQELAELSDALLTYLFVEIRLMIKEKGCAKFNSREEGCIKAFFSSLAYALTQFVKQPNISIDKTFITEIHRLCTRVENVKMKLINEETSGKFRKKGAILNLPAKWVTEDGLKNIINLIQKGILKSVVVGSEKDYKEFKFYKDEFNHHKKVLALVNLISQTSLNDVTYFKDELEKIVAEKTSENEIFSILESIIGDLLQELSNNSNPEIMDLVCELNNANSISTMVNAIKNISNNVYAAYALNGVIGECYTVLKEDELEIAQLEYLIISAESIHAIIKEGTNPLDLAQAILNKIEDNDDDLIIQFPNEEEINQLMDYTIQSYNEGIQKLKHASADEKFEFIYTHLQLFVLIHPFADANNRTFVNILALIMHMQLNLPFKIDYNPFVYYLNSPKEIVETIKLYCGNYLAMLDYVKNKQSFFDFLEKDICTENLSDLVAPLRAFLVKFPSSQNSFTRK